MAGAAVIADASVLILFARAGLLEVLRRTFGSVEIPAAVEREAVGRAGRRPGGPALMAAVDEGWLRVARAPSAARLARTYPNLGRGEAEVLALARRVRPPFVLLDDGAARGAARVEGLRPLGSLGVLAMAHRAGHLGPRAEVERALHALLRAGLWVAPLVVAEFWAGVDARE